MIFYENVLKLRETPIDTPYLAHQRLDFLLQETLKSKLPYCWKRAAHPHEQNSTVAHLRTIVPLGLPGEKKHEMTLSVGDMLLCHTHFCFQKKESLAVQPPQTTTERVRAKQRTVLMSDDELPRVLRIQCEKAGLHLHSHSSGESFCERYEKKRHNFRLKVFPVSLVLEVQDTALAEQAIAYGIGHKRIFGYGQLADMEIL